MIPCKWLESKSTSQLLLSKEQKIIDKTSLFPRTLVSILLKQFEKYTKILGEGKTTL